MGDQFIIQPPRKAKNDCRVVVTIPGAKAVKSLMYTYNRFELDANCGLICLIVLANIYTYTLLSNYLFGTAS